MKSPSPSLRNASAWLLGAVALSFLPHSSGADYSWALETGEGNFSDFTNWNVITYSEDAEPVASENPATQAPGEGDKVTVNQAASTVKINSGDTIAYGELDFSAGFMNISGGTITTTGKQHIGSSSGSGDTDYEWTVSGGATFSTSGERLTFGASGGTTDVLVTGAGTTVSSSGYILVGASGGTVNLTLADGALLQKTSGNYEMIFADGGNSTATVTVSGGSTIQSSTDIKVGWADGVASLTLGTAGVAGDNGYINITDTKFLRIGRGSDTDGDINANNSGTITLNNASKITVSGEAWVGSYRGNGTLILNDDAEIEARQVHVAVHKSNGYIELNDNAKLTFGTSSSAFGLQEGGQAVVVLNDNAQIIGGAALDIGKTHSSTSGSLTLNDQAKFTLAGELNVGYSNASGTLILNNTSSTETHVVSSATHLAIGRQGGTGYVELNGWSKLALDGGTVSVGYGNNSNSAASKGTLILNANSAIAAKNLEVGRENANAGGRESEWGGYLELNDNANITLNGNLVASSSNARARIVLNNTASITGITQINFQNESTAAQLELNGTAALSADNFILRGKDSSITLNDSSRLTITGTGEHKMIDGKDYDNVSININNNAQFVDAGTVVIGHNQGNETGTTAKATINVGDGTGDALFQANRIILGRSDKSTAANAAISELNINAGGTVATNTIERGGGTIATKTINANGGTIRALSDQDNFFKDAQSSGSSLIVNILTGGLTFDTQGFKVGVDTTLFGTGTLTKVGTGTLSFNGSFTGSTVVAAGSLGGIGTLGDITVQSGASLAPGNSVGTLAADNVTLESGATLVLEYDASSIDQLAVTSLTFENGSNLYIDVLDGTGMRAGDILTFANTTVDLSGVNISGTDGYTFAYQGGNLVVTAVPEPSTYALVGAAGLLGLVALRRRRKQ